MPNYYRIGNGTINKHGIVSIDLLEETIQSSKAAQYLIKQIKSGAGWDNSYNYIVKVIGITSTEKQYIKAGYKELEARGLVKRVKQSHYMLNPNALIPLDYAEAIVLWNTL